MGYSTVFNDGQLRSGVFCQVDQFTAHCAPGHVILMKSARYGRMELGKCVRSNYGHLGCSTDARHLVDPLCSGKQMCEFRIFDSVLRTLTPCPEDIESYLEATYQCLPVVTGKLGDCSVHRRLPVPVNTGYLASLQAEEHGLGSTDCPWHLKAKAGQVFVFYMLNFTPHSNSDLPSDHERGPGCFELATIREATRSRSITTCDGKVAEVALYVSQSHDVTVEMAPPSALTSLGKFLIRFEVDGCADIIPPANSTIIRDGNTVEISCTSSHQTWTLVCKDNHWLGQIGNCSIETTSKWGISRMFGEEKFPYGILIVVAIGVALGVFCGGLLLTCAAMYMKRRRQERARLALQSHMDMDDNTTDDRMRVRVDDVTLIHKQYSPYMHGTDDVTHLQCCDDSCLQNAENAKYRTEYTLKTTKDTPPKMIGTFPRTHLYESPRLV
ncbi:hypothetical protein CAPTEDRAFT_214555 [Capitella teleta]|uniref:SUEL-type lectin domain-containing protein n=1 Tax=Capitella teleta TaxID=283909 RepID=R7TII6_CAPTE|nr:hypothetical protein CAPTEDRAFT_214555 [Capitella teleta]|eukprot:ELT90890.1 hypothetical protein CAPTEDRAFT_214555 [Capitella teleta]